MGGVDPGEIAWQLICTALATLTVWGASLFHGGMVRQKNVLATIMYGLTALGLVSLLWLLWGYALAFGPDWGGMIGRVAWIPLTGVVGTAAQAAQPLAHSLAVIFQGILAALGPVLISGALAERMKFSAFLLFVPLWVTFVYVPLVHWVWGDGWISTYLSALDFAGGLVICVSAGVAGLAAALVVGPRRGFGMDPLPPHNRLLVIVGAALLWLGWLGVTAGRASSAGGLPVHVMVVTMLAASTAALGWVVVEWSHKGAPTVLGAVTGSVAGLAAVTAASGFIELWAAPIIGSVASVLCYFAMDLMLRLGLDDACDVFALFGVGGMWGVLATGMFASVRINPDSLSGVFGNPPLLGIQSIALGAVIVYVLGETWVILKLVDWTVGLRVSEEQEVEGLDLTQHAERGYT